MVWGSGLLLLCLVSVGCQGLCWTQGAAGPRRRCCGNRGKRRSPCAGQPEKAIASYQESLATDPECTRNHMSLAAVYLEVGKDAEACVHLAKLVAAHPEHAVVPRRVMPSFFCACTGLTRVVSAVRALHWDMQDRGDEALSAMIHCHSRLMEIAEAEEDDYAAHLHRGIGLFLLARERTALAVPEGELPAEGLLCKAAGELNMARALWPMGCATLVVSVRSVVAPCAATTRQALSTRRRRIGPLFVPHTGRTTQPPARLSRSGGRKLGPVAVCSDPIHRVLDGSRPHERGHYQRVAAALRHFLSYNVT